MNDTQLETIEQITTFLSGTQTIEMIIEDKADRYAWIQRTLIRLHYLLVPTTLNNQEKARQILQYPIA